MAEITLDFIARQLERVLNDNADIREQLTVIRAEIGVMNARLSHIEMSVDSLRRQMERMNGRIRRLEDAQ